MRPGACMRHLIQRAVIGIMACGVAPPTLFYSLAKKDGDSLAPRERLLAALRTWYGRILLAIDLCVSFLAGLAH